MSTLIPILIFFLGASLGSFLSVLIHRLSTGKKGIIFGRSECPSCKAHLSSSELIPIFSYLLSKAKCRHCGKPISPDYLILEIISGLLILAVYLKFPFYNQFSGSPVIWASLPEFIFFTVYSVLLLAMFFYDLKYKKLPNVILYSFIGITLTGSLALNIGNLRSSIIDVSIALLIALIVFGGQIAVSKGKWLGEGDLYLGAGMALILGWKNLLVAIVVSYLVGSIICIGLLLKKEANVKTQIPFAPFLVIGTFFAIFYGQLIINWYSNLISF